MRGFLSGLRSRSLFAPLLALVFVLSSLAAIELSLVFGVQAAIPINALALKRTDDAAFLNKTLASYPRHWPDSKVFFVGASSMRECLPSLISSDRINLSTADQSLAESLMVLDNIPSGPHRIVIGVSPRRLNASENELRKDWTQSRLFLRSDTLNEWMEGTRPLLLRSFFAHVHSYFWKHRHALLKGRLPAVEFEIPPRFKLARWTPDREKRWVSRQTQEYVRGFEKNFPLNLDLLQTILLRMKERGFDVALLDLPLNAKHAHRVQSVLQPYRQEMVRLSLENTIDFIEVQADLDEEDFFDLTHLVESGRKKYSQALFVQLESEFVS